MFDQNPRVLLVEEEATLAQITAFRLELLGYEVVITESAEEALTWLQKELPHVVIVNRYLPGVEGIELVSRLSNDTRTADIPVILMSASADLDDVQKAFIAGADDYLVTPYDPAVLEDKVERLVFAMQEDE